MPTFLVDEDLPRSLAARLRDGGITATDVRDVGLRGHADEDVLAFAREQGFILVTADIGLVGLARLFDGTQKGLVLIRVPNRWHASRIVEETVGALKRLEAKELEEGTVVIEPGRVRIRRGGHS